MANKAQNPVFVVYVTFPSSSKEYCYLCNLPNVVQGDTLIANGTKVTVVRTAAYDPRATKFVSPLPNAIEEAKKARKAEIITRLRQLQTEQTQLEIWQKLSRTNPEAKKLLAEYRRL